MKKSIVVAALIAFVFVGFAGGFHREYVLPADGLVGVRAEQRGNTLLVTGSIFASGARVKKVTTTSSDGDVLIRVYVDRVTPESVGDATGKFQLSLPLHPDTRSVRIGENSRFITVGRLVGVPLRVPRIPSTPVTDRVLWPKGPSR